MVERSVCVWRGYRRLSDVLEVVTTYLVALVSTEGFRLFGRAGLRHNALNT